jgi:hypothetical protein
MPRGHNPVGEKWRNCTEFGTERIPYWFRCRYWRQTDTGPTKWREMGSFAQRGGGTFSPIFEPWALMRRSLREQRSLTLKIHFVTVSMS